MPRRPDVLDAIRRICLSLPDTRETLTWGAPHFRVGDKIFAGYGEERGVLALSFKLEHEHAADLVRSARFWPAPYVGHKGWVSVDPAAVTDWDEIAALVLESYRLIAPRKSFAKLEATLSLSVDAAPKARPRRPAAKARPARAADKTAAKSAARTAAKSGAKSATRSAARLTARAAARPDAKPVAKPAARTKAPTKARRGRRSG